MAPEVYFLTGVPLCNRRSWQQGAGINLERELCLIPEEWLLRAMPCAPPTRPTPYHAVV